MTFNWSLLPLVLVVAYLAWRVWLLEDKAQRLRWDMDDVKHDCSENTGWRLASVPQADLLLYAREQVASLARALGYEWKRTDAKEGWEKKVTLAEALKETCGGGTPFASSFRTVHYDDIPKYTLDRRKADRRKPLYTAQDAKLSSAGLGARKPAKKRRAH